MLIIRVFVVAAVRAAAACGRRQDGPDLETELWIVDPDSMELVDPDSTELVDPDSMESVDPDQEPDASSLDP
jgi:hypothetical protein